MRIAKASSLALIIAAALGTAGCSDDSTTASKNTPAPKLTAADAKKFLEESQAELAKLQYPASQAAWAYQTYIIQDTANVSAYLSEKLSSRASEIAKESAKFNDVKLDPDTRRMMDSLRYSLVLPAPSDAAKSERLAQIGTEMEGMYGAGQYCREDGTCWGLTDMANKMANERNADLLLEVWKGWRQVSPPMKSLYMEQVEIANQGAQELGFQDISQLWRGGYDMSADGFEQELDRLWGQVKPFYDALHCHVRAELGETYGTDIVPQDQAIPAQDRKSVV